MTDHEFALELERGNTEEARAQRDDAIHALKEIYRIRGEDKEVSRIANAVLESSWADA